MIVLDLNLPDGSGLELTRKLKSHPVTASIPIVACTAAVMPADEHEALEAGCDAYVSKPIDLRRFRRSSPRCCGVIARKGAPVVFRPQGLWTSSSQTAARSCASACWRSWTSTSIPPRRSTTSSSSRRATRTPTRR